MSRKPSQRELMRLLRYWQPFLRLSDWRITVTFARSKDMPEGETEEGNNSWSLNSKVSEITILDPRDYKAADMLHEEEQDIELTLVHELLHLHLAPWNTKTPEQVTALEQAIEAISTALVAAKRRKASSPRKRIQSES